MPPRQSITVLVPVLNEAQSVTAAAEAMLAQEVDDHDVEFLFLDGGSEDETLAKLHALGTADSRVKTLSNPDRHIPSALNVGLAAARGDYIARMDAHSLYPPTYLMSGVRRLQRGDVAHVSGPAIARGRGYWSTRVAEALTSRLGVGGASFRLASESEQDVDSGFTGVWRRETLLAHAGWDEDWLVNEDAELASRIREAGGRLVCIPEMAATYFPRDSISGLARQYWRYGQYRFKTTRRHPGSMRKSHALAPMTAAAVVVAVVPGRRSPLRAFARLVALAYALAVALESVRLSRGRVRQSPAVAAVFAAMHLSWGAGFWLGIARFALLPLVRFSGTQQAHPAPGAACAARDTPVPPSWSASPSGAPPSRER